MSDTHSHSVAFVRDTPLPQADPPLAEQGIVKWLRENLFATPTNTVLTVLALIAIYYVLSAIFPWLINGVWTTSSLAECRQLFTQRMDGNATQILAQIASGYDTYGLTLVQRRELLDAAAAVNNGAELQPLLASVGIEVERVTGGCLSVLTERWNQLLFGFKYPTDLYWRPTVAFLLLFLAAAPVLFFDLPRKMLFFTGVYPFLAYWLLWGGTIWVPILALVGVIVGYLVYNQLVNRSFAAGFFGGLLAAVLTWYLGGFVVDALTPEVPFLEAVPSRDMGGYMLNMMLGVTCVSLSVPIGIALALGRQSSMPLIKWICVIFIEFIRGVPLITLLFVANVMLAYFFPPGSGVDLFLRVVIMITMFSAAYIAEVIRGGLAALPKGQYEAADSLGLDYPQAMRLIILPQALKISIPGIVNIAVGLFKDTTLVSVISMFDIVGMIRGPILASTDWNGVYWELLGFACVVFFVVCYGISQYSQWLERRLATDHR